MIAPTVSLQANGRQNLGNATNIASLGTVAAAPGPALLRIFLADDHEFVRSGARTLIDSQTDMRVVGEAADGRSAWEQIRQLQAPGGVGVDVVIMDVSMPNWNGMQTTIHIKRDWPSIKVLALSMHEDKPYLRSLLEGGASGYVLKRSAAGELIRAIRAVADGATYLDPALSETLVGSLVRKPVRGEVEGASLSNREEEVLRLIAQGYANKEIAARLKLSVKTIETHKARSTEKLGLDGRTDIIRYAMAHGWLQNMG
jgi:DNA-binding NarL/FixJ family response regulator